MARLLREFEIMIFQLANCCLPSCKRTYGKSPYFRSDFYHLSDKWATGQIHVPHLCWFTPGKSSTTSSSSPRDGVDSNTHADGPLLKLSGGSFHILRRLHWSYQRRGSNYSGGSKSSKRITHWRWRNRISHQKYDDSIMVQCDVKYSTWLTWWGTKNAIGTSNLACSPIPMSG